MDNAGVSAEWGDILRDLNALSETTITYNDKRFAVRSNAVGVAGKIAQCVGVRLPNTSDLFMVPPMPPGSGSIGGRGRNPHRPVGGSPPVMRHCQHLDLTVNFPIDVS